MTGFTKPAFSPTYQLQSKGGVYLGVHNECFLSSAGKVGQFYSKFALALVSWRGKESQKDL